MTFIGNTASSFGGAIFNESTFTLSDNEAVTFSGNTASSSSSSSSYGGAIFNDGTFTLSGNGDVTFSGNTASSSASSAFAYGGAICNSMWGTFTLSDNGDVLFEKNAEVSNGTYRLRSIYSTGTLNLSASEGKSILFKDSVYASGTVNLNQNGTGDIIFTGATTESDLREVKGGVTGTAEEIASSRSSVLDAMVTLRCGTLQVRDGASLTVRNLTAAAGSELVLHDGTFATTGDTTLSAVSTSGNSTLASANGATLTLTQAIVNSGVLTLSGTINADALTATTTDSFVPGYINTAGEVGTSGFYADSYAQTSLTLTSGTGTVVSDGAEVMYQGNRLTVGSNGIAKVATGSGSIDYSTYYINGDTASLSAILAMSPSAKVQMAGGTLMVDRDCTTEIRHDASSSLTVSVRQTQGKSFEEYSDLVFNAETRADWGGVIYNKDTFTLRNNKTVSFSENSASYYGGAIYNEHNGIFTLSDNEIINFNRNHVCAPSGYASEGGAIENSGTFTLKGNGEVNFSGNCTDYGYYHAGGAISNLGTFTLSENAEVSFSVNEAGRGGAIYNGDTFSLRDNGKVCFSNNVAQEGGAIYNEFESLSMCYNRDVRYIENSARDYGGAICNTESVLMHDNSAVSFIENSAQIYGGAIYNEKGYFSLEGNGELSFSGNSASYGGAIYNTYDASYYDPWTNKFSLQYNEHVSFSGNSALRGGAINNENGDFSLDGNGELSFSGNSASYGGAICNTYDASYYGPGTNVFSLQYNEHVCFSDNSASLGGAIYSENDIFLLAGNGTLTFSGNSAYDGGAIYNKNSAIYSHDSFIISLIGNSARNNGGAIYNENGDIILGLSDDELRFSGNSASCGGAVYNAGCFSVYGNIHFEKNYEKSGSSTYRLRSIYSTGTLNLSASAGKSILFNDSVYASGKVYLGGDIIFTGVSTAADLREVKGGIEGTAQEIADSRSSVLDATVTLRGGTLQVRDAASLTVRNLTAAAGSELVLHDASFAATGNSTLAAVTVTGESSLSAKSGAVITLQQAITNEGALELSGSINADALEMTFVEIGTSYLNTAGEKGRSGFFVTTFDRHFALTQGSGMLNADAAVVTYQGNSVSVNSNGIAILAPTDAVNYGTYYINGDSTSLSSIIAKSPSATVQMTGGVLDLGNLNGIYANRIEGSGAVLMNSRGTVALDGMNTYSGGTRLEAGTLVAVNAQSLGTGAVELAGGTLDLSRLETFANDITGSGSLTVNTEHTLELSGHNTYSGGTRLEAGTLVAGNAQSLGTGAVELAGGALDLSRLETFANDITGSGSLNINTEHTLELSGHNTYSGGTRLEAGTLVAGNAQSLGTGAVELAGGALDLSRLETFANDITGSGRVVKNGNGTVELNGHNTYSGGTRLEAGTLVAGNAQSLGTGAVELAGGALDLSRLETFANDITGAGSLNINTEHTLELSGHNTYSGGTRLEAGTLVAGNVQALGTGAVELAGGMLDLGSYALNNELRVTGAAVLNKGNRYTGKLVLDGGALSGSALQLNQEAELLSGSIANNMTGKGGVVKNGGGIAVLSGMNTYAGTTIVNEGTLQVSGLLTSNIVLNGGTLDTASGMTLAYGQQMTLAGGSVTGDLQTSDGSSLLVQTGTTISGNLTLNGGDITFINKGSDEVLDISGKLTVNPSQMKLVGYDSEGQYVLAHCGALTGSLGNFDLTTSFPEGSRQQAKLTNASNYLILTVMGDATTLNWSGGSGTWAQGNGTKWTGTEDTKFYAYDKVAFEKGGTVTISGEVTPKEMLVGGSTALTLRGTGCISGGGTLTKTGSCTLTMNATNTYTGGTVIEEGVVKAGGAKSFGSERIVLHGGELNLNAKAVANEVMATGGTISGGSAYAGTLTVEGAVALSGSLTAESVELKSGSLTGGELTDTTLYSHGGTLAASLTGESEWTVDGDVVLAVYAAPEWGTYIAAGALTVADGGELDGDVVLTGGSLVSALHTVHEGRLLELSGGSVTGSVVVEQDGLFTMYAESGISGDLSLESGALFENNGNALTIGGTLSVAKDCSAVLSGVVKAGSVSLQQGATVELMEGNALLSVAVGAESLTFSGIELTETGMRGTEEMPAVLDNALLKLAEGTSFSMENLVLGAHTRITDDPAALELNNATVMLAAGANIAPAGIESLEEAVLVQCGGQRTLTTPAGSTVMQLEAATFDSVTLTGNTLALQLSGIEQSELQSYTYVGVSFINGGDYARFDSDLVVTLTVTDAAGNQTLTGWYRADEQAAGGCTQVLFETAMMPEPATATLSLLALAALAARRRRLS